MRLHGAWLATSVAEYFRDRGHNVLLIMDSLTRFAQAQREIGLAIGEAPATKGYPPSVFARMPALVERAGNGATDGGSITAFYTVLTEGDDPQDPIADAARAILDGHIVLSRRIAEAGQYPAIDVEASVSRVMQDIMPPEHLDLARRFRHTLSTYQQNRDLINIGAYQRGSDPRVDAAIAHVAEDAEVHAAGHQGTRRSRGKHACCCAVVRRSRRRRSGRCRMTRVDRLDVVQQVADRAERERAERLAEAERNAIEAEQKLVALERYRNEYEDAAREHAVPRASRYPECVNSRLSSRGSARRSWRSARCSARRARPAISMLNSWREAAQRAQVVQTLADRWQDRGAP